MIKKFLIIALILVLSVAMVFTFVACDKPIKSGGKAIIILPGLMASGLYDSATGNPVWDPFDFDLWFKDVVSPQGINFGKIAPLLLTNSTVQEQLAKISANNYEGSGDSIFNLLAVNEDGSPKVPSVKAVDMTFDNPERLRYGAINAYTEMYLAMEERYGEDYDVSVFNYDFRMDNRDAARKLEQFIDSKNYEEVIFLVHSNGGHVTSIYLANSQKNRDRTSLVACFDSPLTGSLTALTTLENVEGMVEGIKDVIPSGFSSLIEIVENAFNKQFKPLLNMYTVYQLLPTYYMLNSPQYTMTFGEDGPLHEKSSFLMIDDEYVFFDSHQDLYEFYLSRDWARMSNGEVRPAMSSWIDYANASYVTLKDGRKVHSMSLVNTHYIAGLDYPTSCTVKFETQDDGSLEMVGTITTDLGDGVVMAFSSLEGAPVNRIHLIRNADHYDVAQRYDEFSKAMINDIIDDYLASK